MFSSFLTSKVSLASRYTWEIAISLIHSPLVIKHPAIFGLNLSITCICTLPRDTCSYVNAPCVCKYVPYVQKPKDSCLHKVMTKAHLIRGGGRRTGYGLNILVSEATRNGFRDHKFQKLSWGSTPRLLLFVLYYIIPSPTNIV